MMSFRHKQDSAVQDLATTLLIDHYFTVQLNLMHLALVLELRTEINKADVEVLVQEHTTTEL